MKTIFLATIYLFLVQIGIAQTNNKASKPDLKKGLVAFYNFDKAATDASGAGLNGTVNGAVIQEGRCGFESYFFDGIDDYIDCGNPPQFNAWQSGISLSVWVHPKSYSFQGLEMVAGKWGFDNKNDQFGLFINSGGQAVFVVASPGTDEEGVISRYALPLNEWTHIIGVWEANTGKQKLFINGKIDNVNNQRGKGFNKNSTLTFKIGRQIVGKDRPYKGYIDDLRLYNRPLSPEEAEQLNKMDFSACNVLIIEGEVFNSANKQAINGADVVVENFDTGKEELKQNTGENSNKFRLRIPIGEEYALYALKDNFLSVNDNLNTKGAKPMQVIKHNLYLVPFEVGQKLRLNNIFFDTDKAVLRPRSFFELKRLVKVMNSNPTLKIEIAGHTDNQGSDEHNETLSKNRANAVKTYLLSQKISPTRLIAKGYGESQPTSTNDTEEGRQLNRRVEIIITAK